MTSNPLVVKLYILPETVNFSGLRALSKDAQKVSFNDDSTAKQKVGGSSHYGPLLIQQWKD